MGKLLQEQYPEIANDYRQGLSFLQIADKYQIHVVYMTSRIFAQSIVMNAIRGYDGRLLLINEQPYGRYPVN